jgi:multiple sugar transport system permease protein
MNIGRQTENRIFLALAYLVLFFFLVWSLFPFYWMLITSVKPDAEMYRVNVTFFPKTITLKHFQKIFFDSPFPVQFRNSVIISVTVTLASMIFGSLAAYSITRLQFRGREIFARSLIFGYLIPSTVLFIPIFALMNAFRLTNTVFSLMLAYLTFTIPFCTWLLISYFRTIPQELDEAALVDGATRLQALIHIILPLTAPALVVVALFSFTLSWNEFLYALVLTSNQYARTATVGINSMMAEDVFFWGQMMAASAIAAAPPVLMYFFLQKWVVGGLTLGSVKG